MKTTIRLDDHLLAEAKQRAARNGLTLAALIEQALRESLSRERPNQPPNNLPSWGQGWLLPGVNLDDSASLLDLMEPERASADG